MRAGQHTRSFLIQSLFDSIPKSQKDEIMSAKRTLMNQAKTMIRFQGYIPVEMYAVLCAWGAFQGSETDFIISLCREYIHDRMAKLGMTNALVQAVNGEGAGHKKGGS